MARIFTLTPMSQQGIKLTDAPLHIFWGTLFQDALPAELPRPWWNLSKIEISTQPAETPKSSMDDSDDDPEIRNEMSPESDESVLVSVLACRAEKSGLREAFNDTTPIVIFF